MSYQEKQEAKLERYQELAQKNASASVSSWEASNKMLEIIPLGQPILIGHHSERSHRNLLKKSWNAMDRSVKEKEKAEYYENKANNILNPRAISSDDPEAIIKLKLEIKNLEDSRELMKSANKFYKEHKTLEGSNLPEAIIKEASSNLRCWNGVYTSPFPSYSLTNLGANIRNKQKRIEHLEKTRNIKQEDLEINGIKIVINQEDNRVQMLFPGKPNEEIRTKLKSNGFRWSPYNSAWQRQISPYAIKLAKEIVGGIN